MMRLNVLRRSLSEGGTNNDIKDALNENQVIRVESVYNNNNDLNMIVIHLSNGRSVEIGGYSDDDIIYAEIS